MPTASPKPGVPRAIDAGFGVMKFTRPVAANETAINGVVYDSFLSLAISAEGLQTEVDNGRRRDTHLVTYGD